MHKKNYGVAERFSYKDIEDTEINNSTSNYFKRLINKMMMMAAASLLSALLIPLSVYADMPIPGERKLEFQVT